jgi:hypothetical protein
MQQPAKFLVVIDSGGEMIARMFDAERRLMAEFDASSSEVAVMTQGLKSQRCAGDDAWNTALRGHSRSEREQAEVYALDV